MPDLHVDIETYSSVDLRAAGVYRYVEAPDFEVLMGGHSLGGEPVQLAVGEAPVKDIVLDALADPDITIVAHNAAFERICFSRMLGLPTGRYLPPHRFRDTQAQAGAYGYPQKLDPLAKALGASPKDTAGTRLINLFCKPPRALPEDRPEEWEMFKAYCVQDVATLLEVDAALPRLTPTEATVYLADQLVNDRGMRIDVAMARAAAVAAEDNRMVQELEISSLTGIDNPGSQPQLLRWLRQSGLEEMEDLTADTVAAQLGRPTLTPVQRRVLELRQELAGTAIKKYPAALKSVTADDRIRGSFRYFGAHTGRWTGHGVQPQNLPRASFKTEAEAEAAILDLKAGLGAEADTLKKLVRPLFWGPFTIVDYASIEARVLAWLAGEGWALKAFRAGRDIYVETAERMGGLTRAQGKVAVLALGYNGAVNSLRVMGAEGTDNELVLLVRAWRDANPHIVQFWAELGDAFAAGGRAGRITVEKHDDSRALVLPSGRAIWYHDCKWDWVETAYGPRRSASFRDPRNPRWRTRTYGGRLTENVTQGVARDLLAEALVRLHDHGYDVAAHVHDEIIVEGEHPVDEIAKIMCEPPAWAAGLPVDAEGFTAERYRK